QGPGARGQGGREGRGREGRGMTHEPLRVPPRLEAGAMGRRSVYNSRPLMQEKVTESLLGRQPHARLLRYLAATPAGLEQSFLTEGELAAASDLEGAGIVSVSSRRLELTSAGRETLEGRRDLLKAIDAGFSLGESELLESRLSFLNNLSEAAQQRRTVADLFRSSFTILYDAIPYDVGVAVLLEQNLDVYVTRRVGVEEPLSERFATEVKKSMHELLDVSFGETDLVIQGNFSDLPQQSEKDDEPYRHVVATLLRQQSRTAGVLALFSSRPFSPEARQLIGLLSSQVSLVLAGIRNAERIQNLADTDDLTGIWNKRWLRRQLPNEIDRARIYGIPLSLAMLDIDDFKVINDTFGHVMGDVLLSELCGTVRETLRPPDMLARFGGDEFAVVLPHSDLQGARAVAERILQRARDLRLLASDGTTEVRCSVSVGLATYVPDMTAAELIHSADERLYDSKRYGKNRIAW
ncbi:MAG: diguanylate cyclase, partial [Thermoanaerobaculia bacterium]